MRLVADKLREGDERFHQVTVGIDQVYRDQCR